MRVTLAIDPGLRGLGIARFCGDLLVEARYIWNPDVTSRGPKAWKSMSQAFVREGGSVGEHSVTVLEIPQVYQGAKQQGDPDDLLQIAGVVGALAATCGGDVVAVRPRDWKGQLPKDVCVERVKNKLTPRELASVHLPKQKYLAHNVWDAVGLGQWYLSTQRPL